MIIDKTYLKSVRKYTITVPKKINIEATDQKIVACKLDKMI
jgi:hypothetical protein